MCQKPAQGMYRIHEFSKLGHKGFNCIFYESLISGIRLIVRLFLKFEKSAQLITIWWSMKEGKDSKATDFRSNVIYTHTKFLHPSIALSSNKITLNGKYNQLFMYIYILEILNTTIPPNTITYHHSSICRNFQWTSHIQCVR